MVPYLKTNEIRPHTGPRGQAVHERAPTSPPPGTRATTSRWPPRGTWPPSGHPDDRAKILETALLKAMNDKEFTDFLLKSGLILDPGDAQRAKKDIAVRAALYRKYIEDMKKTLGMKK